MADCICGHSILSHAQLGKGRCYKCDTCSHWRDWSGVLFEAMIVIAMVMLLMVVLMGIMSK